jgi:predicted membrane metal-binding protein
MQATAHPTPSAAAAAAAADAQLLLLACSACCQLRWWVVPVLLAALVACCCLLGWCGHLGTRCWQASCNLEGVVNAPLRVRKTESSRERILQQMQQQLSAEATASRVHAGKLAEHEPARGRCEQTCWWHGEYAGPL